MPPSRSRSVCRGAAKSECTRVHHEESINTDPIALKGGSEVSVSGDFKRQLVHATRVLQGSILDASSQGVGGVDVAVAQFMAYIEVAMANGDNDRNQITACGELAKVARIFLKTFKDCPEAARYIATHFYVSIEEAQEVSLAQANGYTDRKLAVYGKVLA